MTNKIYTLIFHSALITMILPSHGMKGPQITQPYTPNTPSISAQYPHATNFGKSLAFAGTAALLTIGSKQEISSDSLKTSLLVAVPVFCGSYVYNYIKQSVLPNSFILDSLLCNPQQTLKHIHKTSEDFRLNPEAKKIDDEPQTNIAIPKIKALIQQYEQKCPFLYLGECTANYCILIENTIHI